MSRRLRFVNALITCRLDKGARTLILPVVFQFALLAQQEIGFLPYGQVALGELNPSPVARYQVLVQANAGDSLDIQVNSIAGNLCISANDPSGRTLGTNCSSLGPRLRPRALVSGVFTLTITATGSSARSLSRFWMIVDCLGACPDPPANPRVRPVPATSLRPDREVAGVVETRDAIGLFSLPISVGGRYSVEVSRTAPSAGSTSACAWVFNAAGSTIASRCSTVRYAFNFAATTQGPYSIVIYESRYDARLSFSLRSSCTGVCIENDSTDRLFGDRNC